MLKSVCDLNAELPLVYSQRKCILATCNLNQWALDFNGNLLRTIASIKEAKNSGATYRLGPELELSGYGCEDHFLENDTFLHCEQSLAIILNSDLTDGILCDIGCPMLHEGTRYNCRVFCLNRRIVLIRPKQLLANDGNYREHRFFTTWKHRHCIQDHVLSPILANATGTTTVPIGDAIIRLSDTSLASEICEELWGPDAAHIEYYLSGVEIVTNGSGSHHSLYKLNTRYDLIKGAAGKNGGVYMYSNSKGCDAGRLYYDGSALICCNGSLLAQASQFSVLDVEVVTACVDLNDVRIHRSCNHSYQTQASLRHVNRIPAIDCSHFSLCTGTAGVPTATEIEFKISAPEEECMLGPACWLWDYLRRSKAGGFLLPLSGGADSAAVATVVYTMCKYVVKGYKNSIGVNREILENDIRHLMGLSTATVYELELQIDANVLCNSILHTVYMGTSNSSTLTESRAQRLAADVNSYHKSFPIDSIVSAILSVFSVLFPGHIPRYASEGGTMAEDLALQNIQARSRMVVAYMCSQLFPWVRYTPNPTEDPSTASGVPASQFRSKGGGFLLVLGSSNVDEALRGYMTKYDCSSADINPIGGLSKSDLNKMLLYASEKYQFRVLSEIATAPPTAELRPIESTSPLKGDSNNAIANDKSNYTQTDEEDMGMSYSDLSTYGMLRKVFLCGPVSMFLKLVERWSHLTYDVVAAKVKKFFSYYAINRHKMTTLTPSYHAERYSPDDNRFDLRPFLYNTKWDRQFSTIDSLVKQMQDRDCCDNKI